MSTLATLLSAIWLLAQPESPPLMDFSEPMPPAAGWWYWLTSEFNLLYVGFLIWMIWYCWKYDPDRGTWIWVMVVFMGFGPIIYFFVRFLPTVRGGEMPWASWVRRRRNLAQLEAAVVQIGNPHHFIQLADALRESRQYSRAGEYYEKALAREPDNLPALWGAANVDFQAKNFSSAKDRLARILAKDPQYKFGDVSLLYGKSLLELNERDAAQIHFTQHVRRWRQPEAMFLLAEICRQQNDEDQCRKLLQDLIVDVSNSPRAIARKHVFWKSRARRLLKKLG